MSVKYSRDDFRANVRGARRHVEYLKDPAKRGLLQRSSTRTVLFTGLFACVGLYIVSLLLGGPPIDVPGSVQSGTGIVVHKQIDEAETKVFVAEIEITGPADEPISGFVKLAPDVWESLEVGQELPVRYTYNVTQDVIDIMEITISPN
jgi:hypothetical protein